MRSQQVYETRKWPKKKSDIAGLKLRRFRGGQVESLNQLGKTDWGNRVTVSMNNYSQGALEHVI